MQLFSKLCGDLLVEAFDAIFWLAKRNMLQYNCRSLVGIRPRVFRNALDWELNTVQLYLMLQAPQGLIEGQDKVLYGYKVEVGALFYQFVDLLDNYQLGQLFDLGECFGDCWMLFISYS